MAAASSTNFITQSEACRLTGISPKSITRICMANNVRIRSFPGLKGRKFHKADLMRLLSAADAGESLRAEARS